jgi:hypothetical protein
VDEMEGAYIRKEESYKRARLWLPFTAVSAVLIIGIGIMFYRNIRQKRHYEQLFFQFKKDELSFINSHEVRRHLSNIMGSSMSLNIAKISRRPVCNSKPTSSILPFNWMNRMYVERTTSEVK